MALLKALLYALGLVSTLQLIGCADTAALGHANGWLRACTTADTCAAAPNEPFGVQAYFDTHVSRYAPHGFYAYFELERDDGQSAVLELDVPIDSGSESVSADQVSYRELDGDRLSFESQHVEGELQLPRALMQEDAYACACADGLFNLRFTAPGADGVLGTADDLARELSYGHLSRTKDPCAEQLAKVADTTLRVKVRECVPPPSTAAPIAPLPEPPRTTRTHSTSVCSYPDCNADDGRYTAVESGCGATTYNESGCGGTSDDQSRGGCNDSSHKEDKHDSNSGCEGDTSNSSSSSSCSTVHVSRRDLRSFLGTGLPLLLVCIWQARRARKGLGG